MPENLILTEHNKNTCKATLTDKFALCDNLKSGQLICNEPAYECCSGYSATYRWKQYEISPTHRFDFDALSSKQAALPPLASVFANTRPDLRSSLCGEKEGKDFFDGSLSYHEPSNKNLSATKDEVATISNPEHFYAERFFNGVSFPNMFHQKSHEKNVASFSTSENTRLVRKRSHNGSRINLVPPNVNTAFKVSVKTININCLRKVTYRI